MHCTMGYEVYAQIDSMLGARCHKVVCGLICRAEGAHDIQLADLECLMC